MRALAENSKYEKIAHYYHYEIHLLLMQGHYLGIRPHFLTILLFVEAVTLIAIVIIIIIISIIIIIFISGFIALELQNVKSNLA